MNRSVKAFSFVIVLALSFSGSATAQEADANEVVTHDFSDRQAVATTIQNFYIGDHTGSIEHKKKSMHPQGAYRFVNRDGVYSESVFRPDDDNADPNYEEELLSIEIYDTLAMARLRLKQNYTPVPEYKLMTLHKTAESGWLITSITWGFGVTQ